MRIAYFRLKGYIKVLNGMGLEEISIPFSTFKNRIILIQGENGCAKSTIISALSPNPDSSDSFRTDVIVDTFGNRQIIEYPAEKEIHYISENEQGDQDYFRILIQSVVDDTKTRRTTKAFISKNGEELNPNGNVTSFKEIRDSVLGIDPIYLDLSSISSENRGIVDMIPSERRKYMASYIGSLDTYNNIFKVISKKVNTLKSYMNTLNSKIYELGDESELRLKLMQMQTSLKDLNIQRDSLIKELAEAEATVRIIDPENKMQDLYISISERLEAINIEMRKNQEEYDKVLSRLKIDPENTDIYNFRENLKNSIDEFNKSVSEGKAKINTLISINESTLANIDSESSTYNGLFSDSSLDNLESSLEKLRKEQKMYEDFISSEDAKILESTSLDELVDLREFLNKFSLEIKSAEELHSQEEFQLSIELAGDSNKEKLLLEDIQNSRNKIVENKIEISSKYKKLEDTIKELEALSEFKKTRPKNCKDNNCPYIKKYIDLENSGISENDIKELSSSIEKLKLDNENLEKNILVESNIDEISRRIDMALSIISSKKSIINKIPSLKFMNNLNDIKNKLSMRYNFSEFNDVSSIIEKGYAYADLKKVNEQIKDLDSDLKIYLANKSLAQSLKESIEKNQKEYNKREEEIKAINAECNFNTGLIAEYSAKLEIVEKLISSFENLIKYKNEKENLKNEFESVKDKIKLVKEKVDSVNIIKNNILKVEESIRPLSDSITQVTFNLSNIVNYQQEYKDSSDKYDKIVFIRNACSPGNGLGIQSEYIKRYMNDIIIDCNQMLGYMFNGSIQLDVPIINEKQFSIPFLGPNGIIVPDISNGSTAQKCMIGLVFSCVAMMKSSIKYNIPRFDEIDGGLDQNNRITFINVLNQILDFMNSEQCIICSHNMEFDTQSTTRLLCSHNGIRIEQ